MAAALPHEVAEFLSFVRLANPPAVPLHLSYVIVKEPYNQVPWFRYAIRERSECIVSAARIVLQSEFLQVQK
jgi:hypothetical protein